MNEAIFNQLDFARGGTLKSVENVTEQEADIIPEGFANSIRWNLGHIYTVHEQFAFATAGERPVFRKDSRRGLQPEPNRPIGRRSRLRFPNW